MQSSDNCLSGGDICGGWPPDPKKECCEGGGMLTLPLTWPGGQPSGAWEQTPQLLKTTQRKTEGERKREREITIKKKLDQAKAYRTGLFFLPQRPRCYCSSSDPMRSFSSFMSKDEPGGDGEQERLSSRRAPVWWGAAPCYYGRPLFSAPAIVWASIQLHCCNRKWVVLPVALEACRSSYGHRCYHSHNPPHLYSSSSWFYMLCTFCSRMVIHSQIHVCQSVCLSVSLSG